MPLSILTWCYQLKSYHVMNILPVFRLVNDVFLRNRYKIILDFVQNIEYSPHLDRVRRVICVIPFRFIPRHESSKRNFIIKTISENRNIVNEKKKKRYHIHLVSGNPDSRYAIDIILLNLKLS